ncbi:hypothetical protein M422DRAFT_782735 [Sphaerobolus stellatus SS14]|uniref:Uncharacterized protein n=1 Tax=Sphaerobolus stellatus (strain SS14) TaxID=990650 RepID=A0A0C9TWR7_SPHS4|nr:hypothetical protein M422DRAFT_782735 [Sphaerobolus stellatus SS14]
MRSIFTTIVLSDPRSLGRLTLPSGQSTCDKSLSSPRSITPYTPLPTELVRIILEIAASTKDSNGKAPYSLQLTSRLVRRWTHPILFHTLEIFGLLRMINFADIFCSEDSESSVLLSTSVKNLSLFDDTTGDFVHLSNAAAALDNNRFMVDILEVCQGVKRLAVNYIRGIPVAYGAKPFELTVRRGLRGINLYKAPFEAITHIHCRYEQLMPYVLPKLAITRLTHVCFTHHLDFPDETCTEVVSTLLEQPQMQFVIVEIAFQKWHALEDPGIRRTMAEKWGPEETRLIVRLSRYETVKPYDEERVFDIDERNVWDVEEDKEWREMAWDGDTILKVCKVNVR